MSEDPFLSRWSRLKKASAKGEPAGGIAPDARARPVAPVAAASPVPADAATGAGCEAAPLPPVQSLTPESDFAPFMGAKVEESLKRRALKTLFQDPRFNVMDGLDVYIDDYSRPDPLPAGWLEQMSQLAHMGDQPARLEEERRAAETTPAAAVEAPEQVKITSHDGPAAPDDGPSSDTAAQCGDTPPVRVSHAEGDRLP